MNLLILYTKNRLEVFNRKSAIGSYIHCLADILSESEINVFLNGEDFNTIKGNTKNISQIKQSGAKGLISKVIPAFIKRLIRDLKHISVLKEFSNDLLNTKYQYDAILEFYNFGSNVGYLVSKHFNIPLYITYDGPILEEYIFFNGGRPFFLKTILSREEKSLKAAKKIVAYSNPMTDFLEKITGKRDHIFIHQNVDFSRFDVMEQDKDYLDERINICFIGSFLKWHQIDLLVNAFSECIAKNINCKLYLIGDGMEREKIQEYVNQCEEEVRMNIEFTGFLDGSDLFNLKKKMHVGVMPGSNWYGAPNKIFEYGAMKMAVVAPKTPTIVDLFDEEEIMFFEWKNQASLTKSLIKILDSSAKRQHFSETLNQKILQKYKAEETAKFYKNLLT